MASELNINNKIAALSLTYYQKFILNYSKYKIDRFICAASSLYIAIKVNEILNIGLDNFIVVYFKKMSHFRVFNKEMSDEIKLDLKQKFCFIENEILQNIGFDFDIILPYDYLEEINHEFENEIRIYSNSFCNDFYYLNVCLYFHPLEIALACIYLSHIFLNKEFNLKWLEKFSIKNENVFNLIKRYQNFIEFKINSIKNVE